MSSSFPKLILTVASCVLLSEWCAAAQPLPPVFESDVLPILRANCASCHGGVTKRKGFDSRTRVALLAGGENGPAIVPGKPEESLLWKKISSGEMPKEGEPLSAKEKETLRAWIESGASGVTHNETRASFQPSRAAAEVAEVIDRLIDARLVEKKITTYPLADDATFLRRASLDLTGRIPTAERAAAFLDSANSDKRTKLIDELLASQEYGQQMATIWHNLTVRLENNRRYMLADFHQWLADGFNAGRGWNRTVSEMLTATGRYADNPAVGFFINDDSNKDVAIKSARLFLGTRLECAECHHHPYAPWSHDNHWGWVAFFSRTRGSHNGGELDRKVAFASVDESVPTSGSKLREYQLLPPRGAMKIPNDSATNVGKVVPPRFLDNVVPDMNDEPPYRPTLAEWITSPTNHAFARATANRIWFQCFGRGLIDPVDDLDDANQPAHPDVLTLLSDELTASGFDYRHILRCICFTKAYGRTNAARRGDEDAARLFARQSLKIMGPEALLDSVAHSAGEPTFQMPRVTRPSTADPKAKPYSYDGAAVKLLLSMRARNDAVNQFLTLGGDNPTVYRLGVLQALRLMNGGPFANDSTLPLRLANETGPPVEVVGRLYLRTLARRPTAEESQRMTEFVARCSSLGEGYAGVLWVLVNSAEFVTVP